MSFIDHVCILNLQRYFPSTHEGTMNTAAIYARVSTKKQEKEGYSITEQLSFMRDIAQRLGYGVPTEYQFHESASAFSEGLDREEFGKVRKLVREGKIDAFIFFDRNRFTRDMGDGVILRREFYQNGVKLILAHPTGNQEGRRAYHLLFARNQGGCTCTPPRISGELTE